MELAASLRQATPSISMSMLPSAPAFLWEQAPSRYPWYHKHSVAQLTVCTLLPLLPVTTSARGVVSMIMLKHAAPNTTSQLLRHAWLTCPSGRLTHWELIAALQRSPCSARDVDGQGRMADLLEWRTMALPTALIQSSFS